MADLENADRKKLIELLAQVQDSGTIVIPAGQWDRYEWVSNQKVTDYLIANGVTIQNSTPEMEVICERIIDSPRKGWLYQARFTWCGKDWFVERKLPENLIAESAAEQKWIPVTERLPDESIPSQHYLCWYKGRVRILKYWRTRKCFESNGRVANVTHWMPLPEPPKEAMDA